MLMHVAQQLTLRSVLLHAGRAAEYVPRYSAGHQRCRCCGKLAGRARRRGAVRLQDPAARNRPTAPAQSQGTQEHVACVEPGQVAITVHRGGFSAAIDEAYEEFSLRASSAMRCRAASPGGDAGAGAASSLRGRSPGKCTDFFRMPLTSRATPLVSTLVAFVVPAASERRLSMACSSGSTAPEGLDLVVLCPACQLCSHGSAAAHSQPVASPRGRWSRAHLARAPVNAARNGVIETDL